MNITHIKYANEENSSLQVTLDDGTVMVVPEPCESWHREFIENWKQAQGIEPWKTATEILADKKIAKLAELDSAYDAATQSGFISNALGEDHVYPSTLEAQLDLIGSVVRGKPAPFACLKKSTGAKDVKNHTIPQFQKVLDDGAAHKLALYSNLVAKKQQVEAATEVAELENISY